MEILETEIQATWFAKLRDERTMSRINTCLHRLSLGNPGDAKPAGSGISEMRIDYGPAYRIYPPLRGQKITILLCGGDKSSQANDIASAKAPAADMEN